MSQNSPISMESKRNSKKNNSKKDNASEQESDKQDNLKLKPADIETKLVNWIARKELGPGMIEVTKAGTPLVLPPKEFNKVRFVRVGDQVRILRLLERNTCEYITFSQYTGELGRYLKREFGNEGLSSNIYNLTYRKIQDLGKLLIDEAEELYLPERPPLNPGTEDKADDPEDLRFFRHNFKRQRNVEPEKHPKWNKIIGTLDKNNVDAFLLMLGGLLAGKPFQRKALLLLGPTGSGKNTLLEIVKLVIGHHAVGKVPKNLDKFGYDFLEDNLLWFEDEAENENNNSDIFKSITGGDEWAMRRMHSAPKNVKVRGNFWKNMNPDKFEPSGESAIWKERMIGVWKAHPSEKQTRSPEEEAKEYIDEVPFIHGMLLDRYEASRGVFDAPIDNSIFDTYIADAKDEVEAIFDKYFEPIADWRNRKSHHDVTNTVYGEIWLEIQKDYPQFGRVKKNKIKLKNFIRDRAESKEATVVSNSVRYLPGVRRKQSRFSAGKVQ